MRNAQKAMWNKLKGGQEQLTNRKSAARSFWKEHPQIKRAVIDSMEISFKEIARGEVTLKDLAESLTKDFGLEIKVDYLDFLD